MRFVCTFVPHVQRLGCANLFQIRYTSFVPFCFLGLFSKYPYGMSYTNAWDWALVYYRASIASYTTVAK